MILMHVRILPFLFPPSGIYTYFVRKLVREICHLFQKSRMEAALYGETTETSIQAGVWQGYLSECEGMIRKYEAMYERLMVIITGGDAAAVKDKLKMTIFAFPDLVLYGLMQMLKYDIEKQ